MTENSKIEWTHHTFNPWVGCIKISPACDNCYAERWAKRAGDPDLWNGQRRRTKTWANPIKWNKDAGEKNIRYRVFCASLADVFDNQVPSEWRFDLWELIRKTPNLDWLLLTKRPQNIEKFLPDDWFTQPEGSGYQNVWLGTTVENQIEADRRISKLIEVPAVVHFLSVEPLLGPVQISEYLFRRPDERQKGTDWDHVGVNWVIAGGESGPSFRKANPDWFRSLRDQCETSSTPFLFKQWQGVTPKQIKALGRELDGVVHDGYPTVKRNET